MPVAPTRWIRRLTEFRPKEEADLVPGRTRGIYALFRHRRLNGRYDVVYIGLSTAGIRARLRSHRRSRSRTTCTGAQPTSLPRRLAGRGGTAGGTHHRPSTDFGSIAWMPLLPSTSWVTRRSAARLQSV